MDGPPPHPSIDTLTPPTTTLPVRTRGFTQGVFLSSLSDSGRYDMFVIGTGPAGQRAAIQAAKLGKKVGICERREVVGGVASPRNNPLQDFP